MDFRELVEKRYSVRGYLDRQVEREKLEFMLETARLAPTAKNAQPQRLYVVRGAEKMAQLGEACRTYGAPTAVIVCADRDEAWVRRYDGKSSADIDASIVTTHLMYAAAEAGLGTLWVCAFKPDVVREKFAIPESEEIVNILIVGYADKDGARTTDRKQIEETVKIIE